MPDRPSLPVGYRLVALDNVASTNDIARDLPLRGAEDRLVVWARAQSAGRGRRGREWVSPPGNLYCSILLGLARPAAEVAQLSLVAALAVGDALAGGIDAPRATGADVSLKWPNDVLLDGRKCCGILLESAADTETGLLRLVVGCGVNIASCPADLPYPVTSLHEAGAAGATVESVLEAYVAAFDRWLAVWLADGVAPVREAWLARARGRGEPVAVRMADRTVEGRFSDLDDSGALMLACADGSMVRIAAGEIFFGPLSEAR